MNTFKLIIVSMLVSSWGPAGCRHYRQRQRCSNAVSPGTSLYSVPSAEVMYIVAKSARLKCCAAWQTPQLAG